MPPAGRSRQLRIDERAQLDQTCDRSDELGRDPSLTIDDERGRHEAHAEVVRDRGVGIENRWVRHMELLDEGQRGGSLIPAGVDTEELNRLRRVLLSHRFERRLLAQTRPAPRSPEVHDPDLARKDGGRDRLASPKGGSAERGHGLPIGRLHGDHVEVAGDPDALTRGRTSDEHAGQRQGGSQRPKRGPMGHRAATVATWCGGCSRPAKTARLRHNLPVPALRLLAISSLALAVACAHTATAQPYPACTPHSLTSPGKALPDCTFEGFNGSPTLRLTSLRGKPTVLN